MLQGDDLIVELARCAESIPSWGTPDLQRFRRLVLGVDQYRAAVALCQIIKTVDVFSFKFDLDSASGILFEFMREADIDNSPMILQAIKKPDVLHSMFQVLVILAKDDVEAMRNVRIMYKESTLPDVVARFRCAAILWRHVFTNIYGLDIPTNPPN
jgi:hypothetical protein